VTLRYRRHPELRLTALDEAGVALHLGTRRYYSVNESGVDLLDALAAPRTLEELVAVLTAKYEVTPETASATAREFLERGVRAGVLLVEDTP